jgi:hypothetical protein
LDGRPVPALAFSRKVDYEGASPASPTDSPNRRHGSEKLN